MASNILTSATEPASAPPRTYRPGTVLDFTGTHNDSFGKHAVVYNDHRGVAVYTHVGDFSHLSIKNVRVIEDPDVVTPTIAALRTTPYEQLFRRWKLDTGITLGADPEVFVVNVRGDVLPAFAYLPEKPKQSNPDVVQSFYDGFQAEFTIPAQGCLGFTTDYIRVGLQQVWDAARKVDPSARLVIDGVLPLSHDMRYSVDPVHLQLGCTPSQNVYGERPLAVLSPEDLDIRFAGSHMHFGLNNYSTATAFTPSQIESAVRMLDAVVGVAMVSFGEGFHSPARRRFYGRAGEYRFREVREVRGVVDTPTVLSTRLEYRTPDVLLIAHPATMNLLWEIARVVCRMGVVGMNFLWDADEAEVRGIINEYDVPRAREVLRRNENILRGILRKTQYPQSFKWGAGPEWIDIGVRTLLHGIGSAVRDPRDLAGNWWLDRPCISSDIIHQLYRSNMYDALHPTPDPTAWWQESYGRAHKFWPTGRIWSSAAKLLEEGQLV